MPESQDGTATKVNLTPWVETASYLGQKLDYEGNHPNKVPAGIHVVITDEDGHPYASSNGYVIAISTPLRGAANPYFWTIALNLAAADRPIFIGGVACVLHKVRLSQLAPSTVQEFEKLREQPGENFVTLDITV